MMGLMERLADPAGQDRDLAAIGALVGHPVRAAMLAALADGRALPATDLARHAGVKPTAATAHLHRLIDGGLVRVRAQGRHRYHELAGPEVAAALEAIARIAPPAQVRSLRQDRAGRAIAEARTCYDHLAGRLGVELADRILASGMISLADGGDHALTDRGLAMLAELGIDAGPVLSSRRLQAKPCLDWTQRRPHLAGAVPAAITARLLELRLLTRTAGRGLRAAPDYQARLDDWLRSR